MKLHPLTLVLGGAASGKSEFAETLAGRLGRRILYVATAGPGAATRTVEWKEKVKRHHDRRPAAWRTCVLNGKSDAPLLRDGRWEGILLDSVTLWVSGQFTRKSAGSLEEAMANLIHDFRESAPVIAVSDEVGMGLVPMGKTTRRFVESLGRSNAYLSKLANRVYFVVSGQPVRIK